MNNNIKEPIGKYISQIYRKGRAFISKGLTQYDMGYGQMLFLLQLYNQDGISQEELTEKLNIDKGTTARSIKKLEKEGFIETVIGKGTFVSGSNSERLREAAMAEMEDKLEAVIICAKALGVTLDECIEILKSIYEEV